MKFWYALDKNLTDRQGRFVQRHIEGACAMSIEDLPPLETGQELNDLALQIEVQGIKTQLQLPQNKALQIFFLSGQPLRIEQLPLTSGLSADKQQQVLNYFNQKTFSERIQLVTPEAIGAFISSDTQRATTQFADNPRLLAQLPLDAQRTLLQFLSEASPPHKAKIIANIEPHVITDFVSQHTAEAVNLFASAPESLADQSLIVKLELIKALTQVQDETLRSKIINAFPDADLVRFISTEPKLISTLCLVQEKNWMKVNFYGNKVLLREVSPSTLFPEADYIRASSNGVTYRNTPYGFRSFYQRQLTLSRGFTQNEKAFTGDGDYFQVVAEGDLWDEETTALQTVEEFSSPENTDERNQRTNQAYALNFKVLVESLQHNMPSDIPSEVTQNLERQTQAFRIFLDGRRFLLPEQETNPDLEGTILEGLVLDYNDKPENVSAIIRTAMDRLLDQVEQDIRSLRQQAQDATNAGETERAAALTQQAESLGSMLEQSIQGSSELLQRIRSESEALRDFNRQSVDRTLTQAGLSESEIEVWWSRLEVAETRADREPILQELISTLSPLLQAQGLSISEARIAAKNTAERFNQQIIYQADVEQGIILTEHLSIYGVRRNFINKQARPVLRVLRNLDISLSPELQAAFDSGQIDTSHVANLEFLIANNQESILTYLESPNASPAQRRAFDPFLSGQASVQFRDTMAAANQAANTEVSRACSALEEMKPTVAVAQEIDQEIFTEPLPGEEPSSEYQEFWEDTRIMADQYDKYFTEHGELPPPEVAQQIYLSVHPEVEPKMERLDDPVFQSAVLEQQNALSESYNTLPTGTNFVEINSNGDFIIESSGPDQTRFIQNPESGEIIAENLIGIPDSEDLKTLNWPLAQVYAAIAGGNVTQGLARITAQSAEHGGNHAMSQYMENLMNSMYRDPNYTFSPNQLHQWEQLGQRMEEYDLTLDEVFAKLGNGRRRLDDTIDPGTPANGVQLIALLEAAVSENRTGFERILGLAPTPTT